MDDLLNNVKSLHFPLIQMCLTKLAITICKHQEIASLIELMPSLKTLEERERYRETHAWKRIEQLSVDIISGLLIPEKFKFRIFHTIWPVCMEINLVIRDYFYFSLYGPPETNIDLQNKLEWTSYGTVDLVRTTKVFIRDERLTVDHRYSLACDYCLEDDIPEIWAKVVENSSLNFLSNQDSVRMNQLAYYWTCYAIEGSKCSERISYKDLFIYACKYGLIEAVKYFFAKLSIEEKRHFALEKVTLIFDICNSLSKFTDLKCFREASDLLFMYFSFLTPSTQQYCMEFQVWAVMLSFAKFPRTASLMEIPRKCRDTFALNFCRIAVALFDRCIDEIDSFQHRGLFLTFSAECPQHFSIVNEVLKTLFAYHLVKLMTFKFPFLLCGKTLQEKREIISQGLNESNFKTNYEFDKESWIFLKTLIRNEFTCVDSLIIEKKKIFDSFCKNPKKWQHLFESFSQISDDLI